MDMCLVEWGVVVLRLHTEAEVEVSEERPLLPLDSLDVSSPLSSYTESDTPRSISSQKSSLNKSNSMSSSGPPATFIVCLRVLDLVDCV